MQAYLSGGKEWLFMFTLLWLPSLRRTRKSRNSNLWDEKKALYLSINVFSTKELIGDTIFYISYWRRDRHFTWSSEPREGLPVRRAKADLHFSVILRSWVSVRPRESNPQPPALQSSAVLTELILLQVGFRTFPIWLAPPPQFFGNSTWWLH